MKVFNEDLDFRAAFHNKGIGTEDCNWMYRLQIPTLCHPRVKSAYSIITYTLKTPGSKLTRILGSMGPDPFLGQVHPETGSKIGF